MREDVKNNLSDSERKGFIQLMQIKKYMKSRRLPVKQGQDFYGIEKSSMPILTVWA